MQRRTFVAATLGSIAIAGCIGDTEETDNGSENGDDDDTGTDDNGESPGDDTGSDSTQLAEELIERLQEELDLAGDPGWEIHNGEVHVRFYEIPGDHTELELIAGIYAIAVDRGFEHDATFIAIDRDDGEELYAFNIEIEWAEAYNADEMSESDYIETVEGTLD